ncbi:23S rRNA (adenine(1618)-N(6))-methyltransferase RlmF [Putridiphycobacter roseus]|uniref:Ribosomal RNA large subunit methyltransferase F n=1 Tax=Putridiphycobacter roseus TaxID=2219161 RepID=A0A2W1MVS5_9FLAO|nr:23S rRNA (adenine(1618)-N(6))-methyltransferase RlmF [Putridiphycobacter roseus]PZE15927.1 23S rRNA (adenine(1618)-N(6))-methyltransferase RlmF [Putridiphycobacter roseus]
MATPQKSATKARLHPRNKNRDRYDLKALIKAVPELKNYLTTNKTGEPSIDFAIPAAVKCLNKALLNHYYGIKNWDFPVQNLCPPIPGRADYLHYLADLLGSGNKGKVPKGAQIVGLDIGTGATCIYPILGQSIYGWKFIGADIDPKSIASAKKIIAANLPLIGKIECRLQKNPKAIFKGLLKKEERITFTMCNPPFHASLAAAQKGSRRKVLNLKGKKMPSPTLNFAGNTNELITPGGELQFIKSMVTESAQFAQNCKWFTTLVSKQENLKAIYQALENVKAKKVKTIPMGTGNKITRIVAWAF